MSGSVREFAAGVSYLPRGAALVLRRRRLLLLGALPAVITTLLLLAVLVALVWFVGDLTAWLTPFADGWSEALATALRIALGLAIVVGAAAGAVLAFAAVTLIVGGPLYDRIAEEVDDQLREAPRVERPWWRELGSSVVDSVRLIAVSVLVAVPLFVLGFVPVAGQVVVPILGAVVGGWLLALELVGVPYELRGLRLADRRRGLRSRRARALGFGIPAYLLCLVPLLAIVVLPMAVAGGTLLARDLVGTPVPGASRD